MTTGALAGLAGGLAGSWVMNQMMSAVALLVSKGDREDPQRNKELIAAAKSRYHEMADPTGEISEAVAERVFHRKLTRRERAISGPVVHYAFGALMGAVYGAAAARFGPVTAGKGVVFGLGLWAVGDEFAVPALRLARKPQELPFQAHASMFFSHMVYGVMLETVRKRALELAA